MRAKIFQVLFIALFVAFGGTFAAQAQEATHMGQKASAHVVLEAVGGVIGGCEPGGLDFVRVLPDGKLDTVNVNESGAFRIPARKVLVVTDVDWQYVHPDGQQQAGNIQVLRLIIENLATPENRRRAFESTITLSNTGQGGISEHMTSGFIVSSDARICPEVSPGPTGPPYGLQHLIVRGYLAPAK